MKKGIQSGISLIWNVLLLQTVLCPQHTHKGNPENRLDSVAVFRRVYINREEHKQVARYPHLSIFHWMDALSQVFWHEQQKENLRDI